MKNGDDSSNIISTVAELEALYGMPPPVRR